MFLLCGLIANILNFSSIATLCDWLDKSHSIVSVSQLDEHLHIYSLVSTNTCMCGFEICFP